MRANDFSANVAGLIDRMISESRMWYPLRYGWGRIAPPHTINQVAAVAVPTKVGGRLAARDRRPMTNTVASDAVVPVAETRT